MQYWEIIADKLSAAGWTWGYCSAVTKARGVGWLTLAGNGRRYVVGSDELLSAFLELEKNIVMRGRRYLGGYKVFAY